MRRTACICCLLAVLVLAGLVVVAQMVQEKKTLATQTATQSQVAFRKMVCSGALTQQMLQNKHSYQKKHQNRTSTQKMTQNGGGNGNGNGGSQGQQGSQSGNRRAGNG